MRLLFPFLVASAVTASYVPAYSPLQRRAIGDVCEDLTVSVNNGGRKVAIVIDSSLSMGTNDPRGYRVAAGRALNDFLISNSEAGGGKKADQVTVVEFGGFAILDYPLGDPGSADSHIANISDNVPGTVIQLGVDMAFNQLMGGGGSTAERSAMIILTDGEDDSTSDLLGSLDKVAAAGIRVSFGFLSNSVGSQGAKILSAIRSTRGIYATIDTAAGSQNFVNFALLNGLTYNDNPQGYDKQLLAGLGQTYLVSGNDTVKLNYRAQSGESGNFSISSISAGGVNATVSMNGKTLNSTRFKSTRQFLQFTAPSSGMVDLSVIAYDAKEDSLFSVVTNSNIPFKNCTVGVTGNAGLSGGAKAGIGVGVTVAVLGVVGTAAYFYYKHIHAPQITDPTTVTSADPHAPDVSHEKFTTEQNVYPVESDPLQSVPPTGSPPSTVPPLHPTQPAVFVPPLLPPQAMKPMQPGTDSNTDNQKTNPTEANTDTQKPNPTDANADNGPWDNHRLEPTDSSQPPNQGDQPGNNDGPPQQPDLPDDKPRIPKIKRGRIEKHHHHHWLTLEEACLNEHCELNAPDHQCQGNADVCPCTCRVEECPVTKERKEQQKKKDAISTIIANAV